MAELRFDVTGNTSGAQRANRDLAGSAEVAARGARLLADSLDKERRAKATSVAATLALAKADKILADAEDELSGNAEEAALALRIEAAEMKRAREQADKLALAQSRISSVTSKLSGLGFLQPSKLSLLPALIPATAALAQGVGAVGASFAAAGVAAVGFGALAGTVLTEASKDAEKLSQLNLRLNAATTGAQRKAIREQISTLESTWTPAFRKVINNLDTLQQHWKLLANRVAAPVVATWLSALTKGLQFLRPLVQPVADVFQAWGQSLNAYFASGKGSAEVSKLATEFGRFAGLQLGQIGVFIKNIATGVFSLGKDLAGSGTNFYTFGNALSTWGTAFASWAASKQARDDVSKFVTYLHDNGHLITGILSDVAKVLPTVFAGASAAGTLELQVLSGFLHWVAGLPPAWQKPLLEVAGALLLLSKLGVLKVGIKIVGVAAKLLTGGLFKLSGASAAAEMETAMRAGGAAAAAEIRAAMAGGAKLGFGEAAAGGAAGGAAKGAAKGGFLAALSRFTGLKWLIRGGIAVAVTEFVVKPILQGIPSGKGKNWWDNPFGTGSGSGFNSWKQLASNIGLIGDKTKATSQETADWNRRTGELGQTLPKVTSGTHAMVQPVNDLAGKTRALADEARNNLIPQLITLHANTPKVRGDFTDLATSVQQAGTKSAATRQDRRNLIADLEASGVNAKTARGLVDSYIKRIQAIPKHAGTTITATGSGKGRITFADQIAGQKASGFLEFHAKGARIPGYGGGDTVPAMLEPGETVVPKHLTPAVAPLMKAHGIKGFAAGGLVGGGSPITAAGPYVARHETGFYHSVITAAEHLAITALRQLGRRALVSSSAVGGDAAANKALARRIFPWGAPQWPAFVDLVMAESGFNRFARNPSSGAYGIPQALPPSKLPFAGQAGGGSHAGPQLSWMFSYIAQRYGTPANAWAHEVTNHWYGSGGIIPEPVIGVGLRSGHGYGFGENGPELVTPAGRGLGGNSYSITVNAAVGSHPAEIGRQVVEAIREFEKRSGPGWRS
jgi:hypothetical protein